MEKVCEDAGGNKAKCLRFIFCLDRQFCMLSLEESRRRFSFVLLLFLRSLFEPALKQQGRLKAQAQANQSSLRIFWECAKARSQVEPGLKPCGSCK